MAILKSIFFFVVLQIMRSYWVKTPGWLPRLFPKELVWKMQSGTSVFLTFDDGPHPDVTPFVLDQLKEHGAKASFFCIGKNVAEHPEIYHRIIQEGHTIGNHTQNHLNGWKQENHTYLNNILQASRYIDSRNYRPPYGRIRMSQVRRLSKGRKPWRIYMWDILSGDFDQELTPEQCLSNVISNLEPGSIVVFHDSVKAFPRLKYVLPEVLRYCKTKSWQLQALPSYS